MASEQDNTVRAAIYSSWVNSFGAPDIRTVAEITGLPPAEIEESLDRLAASHVIVLDEGRRLRMAMPFSAVPTPFRVTTDKGTWFANCAWDSLGIPAALAKDATISTTCADCDDGVSIEVRAGEVMGTGGVIHFAVPAAHWWDDIRFT